MAKKNFKKYLPKVGGTAAVALAMTVAVSAQAHASEVDEINPQPVDNNPPVDNETNAALNNSVLEPAEANQTVEEENEDIAEENKETAEDNEQTEEQNDEAAEKNEEATDGELEDPELDLPEAPEFSGDDDMDVDEYNGEVNDYNEDVKDYNEAVDEYNEGVDEYNEKADEYDQQAQEQYEKDLEEYNKLKAEYEEKLAQYEQDKDDWADDVEAREQYEKDLAEYERLQKEYEEKWAQYELDKEKWDNDVEAREQYLAEYERLQKEYEEKLAQYELDKEKWDNDVEAREQYEKDLAEYERLQKEYEEKRAQYEEELGQYESDAAEYQEYLNQLERLKTKYEEELAKYEQEKENWDNDVEAREQYEKDLAEYERLMDEYEELMAQYEQDKPEYDNLVTEKEIYEDVAEYNEGIETDNAEIAKENAALVGALHADNVENIGEVSEINQNVDVDDSVMEILNGYGTLEQQYNDLLKDAADLADQFDALEKDDEGNIILGSQGYAEYLAAVKDYNTAVAAFNDNVRTYNNAVRTYNEAVDDFNENQTDSSESSTGGATEESDAAIDWGNVNVNEDFNYVDVRYTAAASKTVTVDDDGNEDYSDSVTGYTVTGVYANEQAYEKQKNSTRKEYSISYVTQNGSSTKIHNVQKDNANNEFSNPSHTGANVDPVEGKVSFYVTLTDSAGEEHGITVNMDAGSVYAEGSYYKAESNDFLKNYVGRDGKALETVTIDGVEYYNVSGESVFLISALTCDGASYSSGTGKITPNGLDLILNMQTMIEIHQADNAVKLNLMDLEMEKTARTLEEAPNPGIEPVEPDAPDMPDFVPEAGAEPKAPTAPIPPATVTEPGNQPKAPVAPIGPDFVPEAGTEPEAPTAPIEPDFVPEAGTEPEAPTAPVEPDFVPEAGDEPIEPTFNEVEPDAPTPTERMEHAEKLKELDKKIIVEIDPTPAHGPGPGPRPDPSPDPTPDPIEIPEEDVPLAELPEGEEPAVELPEGEEPAVELPDEEVPLSDIPVTGDVSAAFGAMSAFSAFGLAVLQFLGRKKRDDE